MRQNDFNLTELSRKRETYLEEITRFAGLAKSPLGQDEATNDFYKNIA